MAKYLLEKLFRLVGWQRLLLEAWENVIKEQAEKLVQKTSNPWDDEAVKLLDEFLKRILSNKFD